MIIWINGLSGSGKTTVGRILRDRLAARHPNLLWIDGDTLRDVWGDKLGYSVEARSVNAARISRLFKMLDDQGIHVIASVMSMFPSWRTWYRRAFSGYFEIYLEVPMAVLRERDQKNLYSLAEAGKIDNVVGLDIEFPIPTEAHLTLRVPEVLEAPEAIGDRILAALPSDFHRRWEPGPDVPVPTEPLVAGS